MTSQEIADMIDLAILKPHATREDVMEWAELAIQYQVASLCVHPVWVEAVVQKLRGTDIGICAVVGFPHGANHSDIKRMEAARALWDGATEIDMVMNLGMFASSCYAKVQADIKAVRNMTHYHSVPLKVIIESSLWGRAGIINACHLARAAGATYVKTSTGFGGQASPEAVQTMIEAVGTDLKVKASGGIKTREQAEAYLNQGCARLGLSDIVGILGDSHV